MFSLQLSPNVIEAKRHEFGGQPLPSILIPNILPAAWATQLRSRLAGVTWQAFSLAHRGQYHFNEEFQAPALLEALQQRTQEISGQRVLLQRARWLRFQHRDYSLLRDDLPTTNLLEAQLDLSAEAISDGELCYCHRRQVYFALPSQPLALSIVARGPTVQRFQRYLTHQVKDKTLYRLQLSFIPVG
jgi:hypothetical protein